LPPKADISLALPTHHHDTEALSFSLRNLSPPPGLAGGLPRASRIERSRFNAAIIPIFRRNYDVEDADFYTGAVINRAGAFYLSNPLKKFLAPARWKSCTVKKADEEISDTTPAFLLNTREPLS